MQKEIVELFTSISILNYFHNPFIIALNACVNSWYVSFASFVPPAGYTDQVGCAVAFTHKWTAGVSLYNQVLIAIC